MSEAFYDGRTIASLNGALGDLEEIKTDSKRWITAYRDAAGQIWLEAYEQRAHGDVPSVYSLSQYLSAVDEDFSYARWLSEK